MFVSLKNKPALTGKTWELQRENHIAKSESLNPEFEQYKNYGDILPQYRQTAADCFTIENTLPANGIYEALRLRRGYRGIRIISGHAWTSYQGNDYFLQDNAELIFQNDSHDAVISNVGKKALVFLAIR